MKVKDEIYGEEEILEKVLIELINSKEIQRLKKVSQFGVPANYYYKKGYSRYEHSLGVLILLRKLGADIKEQIAGLIHDISHTAFSHVVDWVIGDPTKEDYQDNIFSKFIKNSNVPMILKTNGFNYKKFLNMDGFSLLEQSAPILCVDRFDYAIREIKDFTDKNLILNNLKNFNGRLVFTSREAAEIFAKGYIQCQTEHWASDEARARYYVLASIIKKALDKKIISLDDLLGNEEHVLNLLVNSNNHSILANLELLKKKRIAKADSEGIVLKKKFRFVDPEILEDGKIEKLSELSKDYACLLEQQKKNSDNFSKFIIPGLS